MPGNVERVVRSVTQQAALFAGELRRLDLILLRERIEDGPFTRVNGGDLEEGSARDEADVDVVVEVQGPWIVGVMIRALTKFLAKTSICDSRGTSSAFREDRR